MNHRELEQEFHAQMVGVYQNARMKYGYNATRFAEMVNRLGGLQTAKRLLRTPDVSFGLQALARRNGLAISMEAIVLRHPWRSLFTEEELRIARERLAAFGYEPKDD